MAVFRRIPIPSSRRFVTDATAVARDRPIIHGLCEADVTDVRRLLANAPDGPISLTGYVVWCLGGAVADHPTVHGYVHKRHLVVFAEVDATVIVETDHGGMSFPRAHVLRDIGNRSLRDLHLELRRLQRETASDTARAVRMVRPLLALPAPLRRWLMRAYLREPQRRKRLMGTVAVTAVGMHATRGFWGIAIPQHSLQIVIGGIETRPVAVDGAVEIRDMLSITVAVDHDVVDGAPAVRFADDLVSRIEDADALRADIDGWREVRNRR